MELNSKDVLRPVGARILVKLVPDNEKIAGSVLVKPDSAQTKSSIGVVLALGDGKQETSYSGEWPPQGIKKGTLLLFSRFAGNEIPLEDVREKEWPRIIGIEEVLGIVER